MKPEEKKKLGTFTSIFKSKLFNYFENKFTFNTEQMSYSHTINTSYTDM